MAKLLVADLRAIDVTRLGAPRLLHALSPDAQALALVAPIVGEGIALGAFQRVRSTIDLQKLEGSGLSVVRRATGGPSLRVGRGQVFVALELREPSAMGGVVDPARALNRHVRPLLRALTSLGNIAATSGGRDLILARGVPIAWVGVGHERESGRTVLEAVIDVSRSFALDASLDLAHGAIAPRFNGATPTTLNDVLARTVEPSEVVEAIVRELAMVAGGSVERLTLPALPTTRANPDEAPFTAMIEEAIGLLGALVERDRVVIGGDLMASADVLADLGRDAVGSGDDELGAAIDAALGPGSGALLLGVRSLDSLRKVVRAAIEAHKNANASGS
jgi:lipoate-protein ligase A